MRRRCLEVPGRLRSALLAQGETPRLSEHHGNATELGRVAAVAWLKLHRELVDKPIWALSTPEQKTVLITLLMMVNHKPNSWEWKGQKFTCQPGQVVTSLDSIAAKCGRGVSIQNIRTALVRFEKLGFLTNESTKQGRLITVINWDSYQGKDDESNKDANNRLTNDQQTPNNYPRREEGKNKEGTLTGTSAPSGAKCPHQAIIDAYHEILPELPRVKSWSETSKKNLRSRWREEPKRQSVEWWRRFFKRVRDCGFLMGRKTEWRASLTWMVGPKNFEKIMNGQYLDHEGPTDNVTQLTPEVRAMLAGNTE